MSPRQAREIRPGLVPRALPATIEPAMHLPAEGAASLAAPPPREWNPQSVAAHAQLAAEGELEENSGIKLLLAIKGLGLFTIGAMIIALGAAYKIAASNA